ncbi:Transcriptional regulator, AsnC family [Nocardiopsis sp. JB363]|nr:Transcriptional regulator, AsnC family [Nocardiopsis sp. JB363]
MSPENSAVRVVGRLATDHADRLVGHGDQQDRETQVPGRDRGVGVRVRDHRATGEVRAISFIEVVGRTTDHVIAELRGFPEIMALHTTNGGWDLVAEISCENLRDFDELPRRMRGINGVVNSETSLLLSSVVR